MDPMQQPQSPDTQPLDQPQSPIEPQVSPDTQTPVSPTPSVGAMQPAAPVEAASQPVVPVEPQPMPAAQPEPTPIQPAAPAQPMSPFGGAPMQPGVMTPPMPAKKSNKKLIILIAVIVGALMIVGVVVVVLIALFTVSKKDYGAALDQYNEVSSANYTLQTKLSSLQYGVDSTTDTSFSNDMDAAKKAVADVSSQNEALSKLKAVNLGEGATKYKTFATKLDAYLTYVNNQLTSFESMRDASVTCSDSGSGSTLSAIQSSIDDCVTALDKVSDVPDADVKEFISKIKDEYESLSSVIGKIAKLTDPYGNQYDQYKSLRDQMYDISDNISSAQTDFQSNLEKHSDAVDPKDAADDLSKYLEDKAYN